MFFSKVFLAGVCTLCLVSLSMAQFQGESLKFKLSAVNLPNCDLDGPSDPYVKLFTYAPRRAGSNRHLDWSRFGTTSVKQDTLNPQWDEVFTYQYINGTNQRWRFMVCDQDNTWLNPFDDHLGRVELKVEDYLFEMKRSKQNKNGTDSHIKPIQMFLTQPMGGALYITPVDE